MASYDRYDGSGPGPIPQRWLNCPRKALQPVEGIFFPFKTPLSNKYDEQIPPQNRFTPKMFIDSLKSAKLKIGLWIDLTNTNRYYSKKEVENEDIKYTKIECKGHEGAPSEDAVDLFVKICHKYRSLHPTHVIAVHCTHGFNRTGFMIASYMVKVIDFSPDMALQAFSRARAPGIYKQDYIDEFLTRFGEDTFLNAPVRPDWCYESDEGGPVGSSNGAKGPGVKKQAQFMEGVDKVHLVTDLQRVADIRAKINGMCLYRKVGFPGSQPVSMSHDNIQMINQNPYHVSWKADGTRYMMLIDGRSHIYLADRDYAIFQAPDIRFKDKVDLKMDLRDTLLDGELVIDVDKITGQATPRYLIYDCIHVRGKNVVNDPFQARWDRITTDIIRPRNEAIKRGLILKNEEPFSIRRKDFWVCNFENTSKLLSENFKRQLQHEPDGLIFNPSSEGYITGRCDSMLKWKPASHNSIDFRAKIITMKQEGMLTETICNLFVNGQKEPFGAIYKCNKTLKGMDNKIVECTVNRHGQYEFMRERTDKSFPNAKSTAEAVLDTILRPIDESNLLKFLNDHPFRKADRELMPPPPKRMRMQSSEMHTRTY